jgi:hypothetical protein
LRRNFDLEAGRFSQLFGVRANFIAQFPGELHEIEDPDVAQAQVPRRGSA